MIYEELDDSRPISIDESGAQKEFKYIVIFEEGDFITEDYLYTYAEDTDLDSNLVLKFVYATFPTVKMMPLPDLTLIPIFLNGIDIKFKGAGFNPDYTGSVWEVSLKYTTGRQNSPNNKVFTFSVTNKGGEDTVFFSRNLLQKASYFGSGLTAPGTVGQPCTIDHRLSGVRGTKIERGALTFSLTVYYDPDEFNPQFCIDLNDLTPCINDNVFLDVFPAGSVKFLGFDSSGQGYQSVPVTLDFAYMKNFSAEADPPFASLTCRGWDIRDYRYGPQKDADEIVSLPIYRLIHEVYVEQDFDAMFGL